MKIFAFFAALCLSLVCSHSSGTSLAVSEDQIKFIVQDPHWRLLLHFRHDWKPGDASEIDGGDFFLSSIGRTNPEAELRATLAAAYEERKIGSLSQHPLCAFKARYSYLSRKLNLTFPERNCEKWNGFLSRFSKAQNISLVFSSAYTNNPASMFGHLFLKVGSSRSSDLLSTGVNFAAQVPPDENPLTFFTFAIFGGYEGHWSVQPYYEKLNEYLRGENRDLWEYELNLTPEEVNFFIEHLWEFETTARINYYFFDDNCAYQMARFIEAVKPQWRLSQHLVYAIPGEQVKNFLGDSSTVREVRFRPALRKVLFQKYDILTNDQKKYFFNLIDGRQNPLDFNDALVLEAASSYMDFQRQLKKGQLDPEEKKYWDSILTQRASLGEVQLPALPPIPADTRPDLGHDAYAVMPYAGVLTGGSDQGSPFMGIKIKSAYHDLYNNDLGYKKYSEILFPWIDLRYRPDDRFLFLEELGILKITSLAPVSRIDFQPSWKLLMAFESPKDFGCIDCRHFVWEGGIGLSAEVLSDNHIIYQFFTMRAEAEKNLPQGHRLLPTFEAGWISTFYDNWKIGMQGNYSQDLSSQKLNDSFYRISFNQSYSLNRKWELRTKLELYYPNFDSRPTYSELRLDLSYFFR